MSLQGAWKSFCKGVVGHVTILRCDLLLKGITVYARRQYQVNERDGILEFIHGYLWSICWTINGQTQKGKNNIHFNNLMVHYITSPNDHQLSGSR